MFLHQSARQNSSVCHHRAGRTPVITLIPRARSHLSLSVAHFQLTPLIFLIQNPLLIHFSLHSVSYQTYFSSGAYVPNSHWLQWQLALWNRAQIGSVH